MSEVAGDAAGAEAPAGWRAMKIGGLAETLGPLLARRDGDSWRYALRTDEAHSNPLGMVHGGTLMTLLDLAATLLALWHTKQQGLVTLQMDTRFMSAARTGDFLEATGRMRHRTRSMVFMDAEVLVGDRRIADATVIVKILGPPREPG